MQTERLTKDVSSTSKALSLAMIALTTVVLYVLYIVCYIPFLRRGPNDAPDLQNVAPTSVHCQASRYAILDDDIDKDESIIPITSGHALVYQGTLRSTGIKVAIKIVQGAPAHAVKVRPEGRWLPLELMIP
ncbi:hypothetical protein ID866_8456 [Astraeus odoratus]|nr:hypothetical protein ID866_8456 [Astraeus odoratus]